MPEQVSQESKAVKESKIPSEVNIIGPKGVEWKKLEEKIIGLQNDIVHFEVEFFERDAFKKFCDNLRSNLSDLKEICITGYFSETIREELKSLSENSYYHIRLISPEFPLSSKRDRHNIEALKKLAKAGVEIKFNSRLHARLLVGHNPLKGLLVIGSFDFNTECIGKERYDAGIKTCHPDLVHSAIAFFEQVWNDSESLTIEEFLKGN